jgi:translation initiation factor 1A
VTPRVDAPDDDEDLVEDEPEEEEVVAEEPEAGEDIDGPVRYPLPDPTKKEMFGIADQLLGASKMIVMCEDGKSRMARIPGKMKRRMWIKPGDLVIIKPWDIQDDKADVRYRYLRTQSVNLSRRGLIPDLLDGNF